MTSELWGEELTDEQTEALLDKAANAIAQRRLETPAMLFFEMHRPLSFMASSASVVLSPFLIPFFGFDGVNDYSRLFSKPENVSKLLDRLDAKRIEPKQEDPCDS